MFPFQTTTAMPYFLDERVSEALDDLESPDAEYAEIAPVTRLRRLLQEHGSFPENADDDVHGYDDIVAQEVARSLQCRRLTSGEE